MGPVHRNDDSWLKIGVMIAALIVVACDIRTIPFFIDAWWPIMYGGSAAALFWWRVTYRPVPLRIFGALLPVASLIRALDWIVSDSGYWAGAAINLLLAMLAFEFVRNRNHLYHHTPLGEL